MSSIVAHMVTRIVIVAALGFASGCAAVSADAPQANGPASSNVRGRDAERIQLRMNRHAEHNVITYR